MTTKIDTLKHYDFVSLSQTLWMLLGNLMTDAIHPRREALAGGEEGNGFELWRQAFLLHRLQYGASAFSHLDALAMTTTGSARCLGRSDIGSIRIGASKPSCL